MALGDGEMGLQDSEGVELCRDPCRSDSGLQVISLQLSFAKQFYFMWESRSSFAAGKGTPHLGKLPL